TVLEPASERGNAGVDELQEQTVNLLNFQKVENKIFRGQLAFNILPEAETAVRTECRIAEQLAEILGKTFPQPLISAVQAPVFHSHAFSIFVRLLAAPPPEELSAQLRGNTYFSTGSFVGGPSPVGVVGTERIHIGRVQYLSTSDTYALWVVADNLRIAVPILQLVLPLCASFGRLTGPGSS